jgi:hypothetical protein
VSALFGVAAAKKKALVAEAPGRARAGKHQLFILVLACRRMVLIA